MLVLGIGGWLHDGAAAVLRDGEILAAIEEEKLSRRPHANAMPEQAVDACLAAAGATRDDVDYVAIARPIGQRGEPLFHVRLKSSFPNARLVIADHHDAHAASAFFLSPFDKARVLTVDRRGDMRCGALWRAEGGRLEAEREYYAPDSPALLYSRVTELLGFRSDHEEHKVQWLSVGGKPVYQELFETILGLDGQGGVNLDSSYFDVARPAAGGFSDKFFRAAKLKLGEPLSKAKKADLAASVQAAVERAVLEMAGQGENLCLAGGLAMNAMIVAAIERSGRFQRVWVQPAGGNAGTALGAALLAWRRTLGREAGRPLENLFLGPEYDEEEIKKILENCKLRFQVLLTDEQIVSEAVQRLSDNQILAWFQGRTEFGPRALGNRSLLASPLNPYSTVNLNQYIKRREDFRKFAAAVPEERAAEFFECGENARFLATVSRVRPEHRSAFSAALLDDERIRVQVVRRSDSPLFWELLQAAGKKTGLPVLYNTSFNLFGEPLVSDPRAAVRSFYASGVDAMFVGGFLLEK
ncbi:MAG: carbamoyltransferase [Acidobacteria bacterium]|nr:carbamoyltransferase [Acidobacteriota bacterium]